MDERTQILIVEDERIIALEMRHKLESMGYDVSAIVSSGEEAVRMAEELHPDLVLMDIVLQGEMDGVEAAGQIRTRFDIPVVYVTANVSDARLEDIARSEPFGCLFKPFEDMELQAAVKMAVYRYSMERKLRESEKRFKHLVMNSNDMMVIIDENGKETYVSDSVERITGFPPEEVLNCSGFEFLHPDDVDHMSKTFSKLLKLPGETVRDEYRHRRKGGGWVYLEAIGTNYLHEPSIKGIVMNVRDITDRRLSEESLRKSDERFRAIFESRSEGYAELDLAGRFTFFNETMLSIMGVPADELIGMSYREYTSPETAERLYGIFNKIYRTGESAEITDYEITKKDGRKRTMEASVHLTRDKKGETVGFRNIVRDATKRKETEESLVKSEERFRTIIESMEDGYYEVDFAGRFTFFNEAMRRIADVQADELMGMSDLEYTSPETAKKIYKTFNKVYRTGKPADVEDYEVIRTDGSKRTLEFNVSLIRDDKEEPVGFRGIVRDITERKRLEALLVESEERYRNLVENMSEVIFSADEKGALSYVSPSTEQMTGFKPHEVIGRPVFEFLHSADIPLITEQFKDIISGIIQPKEYRLLTKQGELFWVNTHAQPIYKNKRVIGIQ